MGNGRAAATLATVCGWPPGFGSWCGVAHSSQARSAANIAPVLRLPQCGRPPWRRRLLRQSPTNVNPKAEAVPSSRRLTASPRPRPNPAALAAPGSQSPAPRSFPCSPSPPRAAPAGGLPA
ncbi:putative exported protein [Pectobacterium atrosepticum SCRI1043]|uniref:Exported protein n=1 Tax=Pectobacterium atrosepticum (strain SCRI 1043 / ATCC BAA-672) TaxID=218491 RepID=Q6D1P8_PECAS|nr:putative exported protein [Pectobacterium atrosepticum SCRI1043]